MRITLTMLNPNDHSINIVNSYETIVFDTEIPVKSHQSPPPPKETKFHENPSFYPSLISLNQKSHGKTTKTLINHCSTVLLYSQTDKSHENKKTQKSHVKSYGYESKLCMERSALFRTYGTKGFRNWSCSGRLERDEV